MDGSKTTSLGFESNVDDVIDALNKPKEKVAAPPLTVPHLNKMVAAYDKLCQRLKVAEMAVKELKIDKDAESKRLAELTERGLTKQAAYRKLAGEFPPLKPDSTFV